MRFSEFAIRVAVMGSRAYDTWWGLVLRTTTRAHMAFDRATGSRFGHRIPGGGHIIWITTQGRKSGQMRRIPLLAAPMGDDFLITGSNAGQSTVPGWVFNVRANPAGFVESAGQKSKAVFTEITGAERELRFQELVSVWAGYDMYARNAGRVIPVFTVHPLNPIIPIRE